jgi:hypothetical protein
VAVDAAVDGVADAVPLLLVVVVVVVFGGVAAAAAGSAACSTLLALEDRAVFALTSARCHCHSLIAVATNNTMAEASKSHEAPLEGACPTAIEVRMIQIHREASHKP